MPGRIRDEDVQLVKERADIAEVVGEQVTLRNAGGGNLKGLCPFHDEKTPSFSVRPSVGAYHCFGCGEGGDVISFVRKTDHLSFAEAVERLADRYGIQLRYEEGGAAPGRQQGQRTRLVEANRAAEQFYVEQLSTPGATAGRAFLTERGFDRDAAEAFRVGFAPRDWDALVKHLRGRGFADAELVAAGLAREGPRGLLDRFLGRLLWPIRDITGDVVGFGARRIFDDDRIEAKYVNTPETSLYKKSQVLYGVDLAKKEIARRMQAVVVEGYTDVMACHLSGVPTAIATCGTAFGDEHVKILRRLLMDQNEFRGEVVFTFDGDSAGQKAADRAFTEHDQKFVTQTFVAVEPSGMDPCELRQHKGDAAVRELVARRVPLFEFAIRHELDRFDLNIPEGRSQALARTVPIVARIRDTSMRDDYARQLAGWVGLPDPNEIVSRVRAGAGGAQLGRRVPEQPRPPADGSSRPDPRDPAVAVEREALKVALQAPERAAAQLAGLGTEVFTAAPYAVVAGAIANAAQDGVGRGEAWVTAVRDRCPDDASRSLLTELAVEPARSDGEPDDRYATSLVARLEEIAVTRRITELKSRLQRLNPVEQVEEYNRRFGELVALEQHRRTLREKAIGGL
jgi:DNA primase